MKCLADHKITKIGLDGNPVVASEGNYKEKLFELIPSLTSIDGVDKNGNPVESTLYGDEEDEEEEDGEFDAAEGEEAEDGDDSGEDFDEDDEDDEENEDEEDEKAHKKAKH